MRWSGGLGGEERANHSLEQTPVEYAPHVLREWIEDGVAKAKALHLLAPTAPRTPHGKTLPFKTH